MRNHESWLPNISRIAVVDGEIVGVIMYFEAKIKRADCSEVKIASFGPLCVSHKYRSMGVGKKLMAETLPLAKAAGYHLKRKEENPVEFDTLFAKLGCSVKGEEIRRDRTNHGFIIVCADRAVGICVISTKQEKPEVTQI